MDLLRIFFIIATAESLTWPFASAQNCNNTAELWCKISPNDYRVIEVSKYQPGRIICTIPHPKGLDIRIVNQFGEEVRTDSMLSNHVSHISTKINPMNKSYELEIDWPPENGIQERLKIIQCIGLFYGATHPCRTSLVNIQFAKEEDATTTSMEASTITTELETKEEKVVTTSTSADTTTAKITEDDNAIQRR